MLPLESTQGSPLDRCLRMLSAVTRLINSAGLSEATFQQLTELIRPWLPFDMAAIALLDPAGERFDLHYQHNYGQLPIPDSFSFPRHDSVYGWVIEHRRPVLVPDIEQAPQFGDSHLVRPHGVRSRVAAPLIVGEEPLGALGFGSCQVGAFGPSELELATLIADEIAIALENRRLLERVAQTQALEEADRLKSLLLSTVSHELRTPLGLIKGYLATLERGSPPLTAAEREECLHVALEETDNLAALVERLLDTASVESGRLTVRATPRALGPLLKQSLRRLRPMTARHQIRLEVEPALPRVLADEQRLGQVVRNLIENAVSYAPPGSAIRLRASRGEREVLVAVEDQGPGIPAPQQARLFTPFTRLDDSANGDRRRRGLGLGLAIVRGIVEAHGGRVWVESQVGAGSRFCFTLPLWSRTATTRRARQRVGV